MQERLTAKPTIRIIAEVVGVSQSTVSRALAGSEAISEETRLRVHEAARRLHYPKIGKGKRPTRMIGVVVSALNNSFYVNFLDYLHDALRDLSFHMTLIIDSLLTVEDVTAFQPIIDNVLDGIIFTTATIDSEVVPTLSRRNFPIVLAVRSVDGLEIDKVVLDDLRVGEAAARHLYELGHRRIGFMMGPRNVSTSRDRFAGALRHLEIAGVPPWKNFACGDPIPTPADTLAPCRCSRGRKGVPPQSSPATTRSRWEYWRRPTAWASTSPAMSPSSDVTTFRWRNLLLSA
jgi:LacI family transcriptional regulator